MKNKNVVDLNKAREAKIDDLLEPLTQEEKYQMALNRQRNKREPQTKVLSEQEIKELGKEEIREFFKNIPGLCDLFK